MVDHPPMDVVSCEIKSNNVDVLQRVSHLGTGSGTRDSQHFQQQPSVWPLG